VRKFDRIDSICALGDSLLQLSPFLRRCGASGRSDTRQRDKETERQRDRETERQRDKDRGRIIAAPQHSKEL
jgi:hypothetical protein